MNHYKFTRSKLIRSPISQENIAFHPIVLCHWAVFVFKVKQQSLSSAAAAGYR